MGREIGIWDITHGVPRAIGTVGVPREDQLEALVVSDPAFLGLDVLVLGTQIETSYGTRLDVLAMDSSGEIHVIELKRARTPRDAVAQLLDYGSWVAGLTREDIAEIHAHFHSNGLDDAFVERFGTPLPEVLNDSHHLVLVSSDLDDTSARVLTYLAESWSVPVRAILLRYFRVGDTELLARTWIGDPVEPVKAHSKTARRERPPWNGNDFYVVMDDGPSRRWEDCRNLGYVSAGGGERYSKPLTRLAPGNRVFVHIAKHGYVAVGEVLDVGRRSSEHVVVAGGSPALLSSVPGLLSNLSATGDEEEWVVPVRWLSSRPLDNAYWEQGLFAKQHIVCELRDERTRELVTRNLGVSPTDAPRASRRRVEDLLEAGLIQGGQALFARYFNSAQEAFVEADGSVLYAGQKYSSLSAAGAEAKKTARDNIELPQSVLTTDGWRFWSVETAEGLVSLRDLYDEHFGYE